MHLELVVALELENHPHYEVFFYPTVSFALSTHVHKKKIKFL